ncbi:MAG: hypothetical protein MHM6MM_006873 [Cercozoa sp. M6MM]
MISRLLVRQQRSARLAQARFLQRNDFGPRRRRQVVWKTIRSPKGQRYLIGFGVFSGVWLLASPYMTNTEVPFTERKQLVIVPFSEEISKGAAGYQQLKVQFNAQRELLPRNHPVHHRIEHITRQLLMKNGLLRNSQYEVTCPNLAPFRDLDWEVVVVHNPTINAMCIAGGKILVFTGLLEALQLDDDEVAAVIAHEIGHALARHHSETTPQLFPLLLVDLFLVLSGITTQLSTTQLGWLKSSRDHEVEADLIGMHLCAAAGIAPEKCLSMSRKLGTVSDPGFADFLTTHPRSRRREKALEDALPVIKEKYKERLMPRDTTDVWARQVADSVDGVFEHIEIGSDVDDFFAFGHPEDAGFPASFRRPRPQ